MHEISVPSFVFDKDDLPLLDNSKMEENYRTSLASQSKSTTVRVNMKLKAMTKVIIILWPFML